MIRGLWTATAALALAGCAAATAQAQEPFAPYDGTIPFRCELQDVGTGVDFPDPDADPFCVKFDKTQQNVTDFGIVDFLLNEPGRVAAATPKCFYFQRDHWTGSIVQDETPELWNWVGNYWFDKARGLGGVSVRRFRVGGVPADMTPFVPDGYLPYFDAAGGGGVQMTLASNPDPVCGARVDTPEEREKVYRDAPRTSRCRPPGGELRGRRVGRAKLGIARTLVRERMGPPRKRRHGVDRWCLIGKANLRVGYADGEAVVIRSSSRGHALAGVARGDRARRARRRFGAAAFRVGSARVIPAERRRRRAAFVAVRGGRVRWIAIADPQAVGGAAGQARSLRRTR